jgi:hypothetical protein
MSSQLCSVVAVWSTSKRALAVFGLFFVVYQLNFQVLHQVDCIPAPYAAWSLIQQASFTLDDYEDLQKYVGGVIMLTGDGDWISKYPPGGSLMAVPFALPFALFSDAPLQPSAMRRLGKAVAAACTAAAVALFYLACLAVAPRAAPIATLLLGLGTGLWAVASQALWAHGPATFWLCLALYLVVSAGGRTGWRSSAVGLALGFAILCRPSTGLFAVAQLGVLLWRREWRELVATAIGIVPGVAFFVGYNVVHFDAPLAGGYLENLGAWSGDFSDGLFGLLLAPSRGLLVYAPALLVVPWGIAALVRHRDLPSARVNAVLIAWLLAAAATLLFYARWRYWWGGWCFGPRYLCEILPVLCLAFALAYERARDTRWLRVARALVAISIAVQVVGVFGDDRGAWNARHPLVDPYSIDDTQIGAHMRSLLGLGEAGKHRHAP